MGFLIPPHSLTNFEIQKYYKSKPRFNGVFSRNNLSEYNSIKKIKNVAYIINLDEYANVGIAYIINLDENANGNANMQIHIELPYFLKRNEIVYFDSFSVEYIPEEIKKFIKTFPGNKNIKTNIFRVQEDISIMCGYFSIGFIDFM